MTTTIHDASEYRACVDPLHRNTWPIRIGNDETVVGNLTEHITVNFDGDTPPIVRWTWAFDDAEANALHLAPVLRSSRDQYLTWRDALHRFTRMHQLAVALREVEWNVNARVGE